jgi:DNA-binding CsgD family transcriptional regulator
MLILGTEMHLVTGIFIVLESLLLIFQLILYYLRPNDEYRKWYLILLALLLVYNITGGFFPDTSIDLSIQVQNIIAYGSGFMVAAYFPFYFYKAFDLKQLRFHAIYGASTFLLLPYLVFFVISYSFNGSLDFAIKYGIIVPFFYSFIILRAIFIAIRSHYKDNLRYSNYIEEMATYCAVAPWGLMAVISYFQLGQLVEVLVANLGFLIITIMFILKSLQRVRKESALLVEFDLAACDPAIVEANCKRFGLTSKETEIVQLICQRLKHKEIAERLFISPRTVDKHAENIYNKIAVNNRAELIRKMSVFS